MKKLFSLIIALMFITTLSACGMDGNDPEDNEPLEDRITDLEDTVSDQRQRISEIENVMTTMEAAVNEEKLVFTVDTGEEILARTVPYSEHSELNAFELLNLVYDIDYTESDQGVFLDGIESLDILQGSFIAISKNGEMIETGLTQVSFEGGDHFHFERSWWDETSEALNDSLENFIENHGESFIESGNYLVALGLYHLGKENMIESLEVPTVGEDAGAGELIRHIFISEILNEDASDDRFALLEQASIQYPYSAALNYIALATGDLDDYSGYVTDFKTMLDTLSVTDTDDDSLSMVLAALGIMNDADYDTLRNDIVTHLEDNIYAESGGEYDPGVNSAGLASAVTALIAVGEDPTSGAFTEGGDDLIQHLLAHQTSVGAFRHTLENEDADLSFSTPQAFLALAAYQASLNDDTFTHPFRVE